MQPIAMCPIDPWSLYFSGEPISYTCSLFGYQYTQNMCSNQD